MAISLAQERRCCYGVEIATAQAPRNDNLLDSEHLQNRIGLEQLGPSFRRKPESRHPSHLEIPFILSIHAMKPPKAECYRIPAIRLRAEWYVL